MTDVSLCFERWLGRYQEMRAGPSSPRVRRLLSQVRLRGAAAYDFVSCLAPAGGPVVVDLWTLRLKPADRRAFGEACANLELANCLNDQVREKCLTRGRDPRRWIVLRGNLVSPSVAPCPELSEVAESGHRMRLWTYSLRDGRFEVWPYCATSGTRRRAGVGTLSRLLTRLSDPLGEARAAKPGQRRRFERRQVSIRARVMLYDGTGQWAGEGEATISDLSPAGARLTAFSARADLETLSAGSVVLFPSQDPGNVAIPARIVRFQAHASPALGVKFRGLSRPSRMGLKRILLASGGPGSQG